MVLPNRVLLPKVACTMANSVDPDQTAPDVDPNQEQTDLGLQCLPSPIFPKT